MSEIWNAIKSMAAKLRKSKRKPEVHFHGLPTNVAKQFNIQPTDWIYINGQWRKLGQEESK